MEIKIDNIMDRILTTLLSIGIDDKIVWKRKNEGLSIVHELELNGGYKIKVFYSLFEMHYAMRVMLKYRDAAKDVLPDTIINNVARNDVRIEELFKVLEAKYKTFCWDHYPVELYKKLNDIITS